MYPGALVQIYNWAFTLSVCLLLTTIFQFVKLKYSAKITKNKFTVMPYWLLIAYCISLLALTASAYRYVLFLRDSDGIEPNVYKNIFKRAYIVHAILVLIYMFIMITIGFEQCAIIFLVVFQSKYRIEYLEVNKSKFTKYEIYLTIFSVFCYSFTFLNICWVIYLIITRFNKNLNDVNSL